MQSLRQQIVGLGRESSIITGSAEDYFAHPGISRSDLDWFWGDPVSFGRGVKPAPTAAMQLGAAFHRCVEAKVMGLTPPLVVVPQEVLSGSGARAGKRWIEFRDKHQGLLLLSEEEQAHLDCLMRSLDRNAAARSLITGCCDAELGLTTGEGPRQRKCRIDACSTTAIVDVKTTIDASPEAFRASIFRYGYHRQAAWYKDIVRESSGLDIPFVFLAASTKPPHRVECYVLDDEFISLGWQECQQRLDALLAAKETGVYEYPTTGKISVIHLHRQMEITNVDDSGDATS